MSSLRRDSAADRPQAAEPALGLQRGAEWVEGDARWPADGAGKDGDERIDGEHVPHASKRRANREAQEMPANDSNGAGVLLLDRRIPSMLARMDWLAEWSARRGVQRLPEQPLGDAPGGLLDEELPLYQALTSDARRREWWAGRVAAHAALRELGLAPSPVLRGAEGAPEVRGAQVTLSHGGGQALAVAWKGQEHGVGVDLVSAADIERSRRVLTRWAREGERRWLDAPLGPGLLWGAREAIAKASRTGMFAFALTEVHVTEIRVDRIDTSVEGAELRWEPAEGGGVRVFARMDAELCAWARARTAERSAR